MFEKILYIRLDDASEYMDVEKWELIERILDEKEVKPIFGIIPKNEDESLVNKYKKNYDFWNIVNRWINKGWIPAMHGYEHRYLTLEGGINPVNKKSEFAGLSYEEQAVKIRNGYRILEKHNICPTIFFAPAHTFDKNTLLAIKNETPIRIISDTIATDIYKEDDFYFIPQQSGRVRSLPFKTITYCYHPNTMGEQDYLGLKFFLNNNHVKFKSNITLKDRKKRFGDKILQKIYYVMHE